jgi:hypothetical protein
VTLLKALGVAQGEPHRDHGRVFYSPRVKPKYCENIEKKYGKDSAVYDVRVRGIFPRAADDAVIPLEWAERAQLLDTAEVRQACRSGDAGVRSVARRRGRDGDRALPQGRVLQADAYKTTKTTIIMQPDGRGGARDQGRRGFACSK